MQSLFIIFRLNLDVFFLGWSTNLFSHFLTARNLLHLWSCSVSKHTYIRYLDQSIRVIPNLVPKEIWDFIGFSLLPTVIGQENSQTIKYNLDWVSLSCAWVPMVGYVRYFKHSQFIIVIFFSQFLQGLACLDFKRDEFIRRKIKQIFISYFRLFNQVRATFIQLKERAKESLLAQAREKMLSIAVIKMEYFWYFLHRNFQIFAVLYGCCNNRRERQWCSIGL